MVSTAGSAAATARTSNATELEKHDENPGQQWGRFSITSTRSRRNERSPENDEVSLISPPSSNQGKKTRKTRARKSGESNSPQNPIEIKEDCAKSAPRSSTDRKPGEYVDATNFIIPKTRHQTALERTQTNEGKWLNAQRTSLRSKSNDKDTVEEISSDNNHDVTSDSERSLCARNSKLSENLSNDDALQQIAQEYNSDNDMHNDNHDNNKTKLDITPRRFPKTFKNRNLRTLHKKGSNEVKGALQEETNDNDNKGTPKEVIHGPSKKQSKGLTLGELFCLSCGGGLTNDGCKKCDPQAFPTLKNFYGSKTFIRYSATKKIEDKKKPRNRTSLNSTSQTDTKNPDKKQTVKPKKRKSAALPQPELVHISSDEEVEEPETSIPCSESIIHQDHEMAETAHDGEINAPEAMETEDDVFYTEKDIQQHSDQPLLELSDSVSMEIQDNILLTDTIVNTVEVNTEENTINNTTIMNNLYQRDDLIVKFPVTIIYMGQLIGTPVDQVEVTAQHISIQMFLDKRKLMFQLEENDLKSFKVSNDGEPLFVVVEPTPEWTRKILGRYSSYGKFIDPGSRINEQKQIIMILEKKIPREHLADLVELINERLGGSRMFGTIMPAYAKKELERMQSSNTDHDFKCPISSSSSSSSTLPTTVVTRKSYNTRSKDRPNRSTSPSVLPEKVLIYPALSKMGGVTVTTEDMQCLQPETYLNDVIIDFFLKYLVEEVLSVEDQKRTHIFSSFFYKRLTLKKHGGIKEPRTPETMHSLVKTWTKNVDIFSKDFLIVPINECSHWYLAIICFPGLVAKQQNIDLEDRDEENENEETTQESPDKTDKNNELISNNYSEYSDEKDFDVTLKTKRNKVFKRRKSQEKDTAYKPDDNSDHDLERSSIEDFNTTPKSTKSTRGFSLKRKKSHEKVPLKSRPCILLFDSLSQTGRSGVLVNLRNYLTCEWRERKSNEHQMFLKFDKNTLKACFAKVPGQNNSSDCGLYLLQYVESFFKTPIDDYNFPINIPRWFPIEIIQEKRDYLRNLIYKLKERIHA